MAQNEINLSSLMGTEKKARDKDEYILEKTNITREQLDGLSDEKYNQILDLIKESLQNKSETNIDNKNNSNEQEKQNDDIEENKEKKLEIKEDENGELFSNYKSDFKKEENQLFKKIREKRLKIREKLRMPKTRVSLVIGLILITVISISALFTIDPEHHSFQAYKANILNVKNKYFSKDKKITKTEKLINNVNLTDEQTIKLNTLTGAALEKYKQEIIREVLKNKYKN